VKRIYKKRKEKEVIYLFCICHQSKIKTVKKSSSSTYDPAPTMDDIDTQNKDTADIAWGVIEVKEVRDGIITTPPPIPHMEAKNPATIPVGTATLFGTYDGLVSTVVERILEITWLFTLLLINGERERTRRPIVMLYGTVI
jgi:hypothetical protein